MDSRENLLEAAQPFQRKRADDGSLEGLELAMLVLGDGTPVLSIAINPEAAERMRAYARAARGIASWIASRPGVRRVRTDLIRGLYDLFPEGEPLPGSEARQILDSVRLLAEIEGDPLPESLGEARAIFETWVALEEAEPPKDDAPLEDPAFWSDENLVPGAGRIEPDVQWRTATVTPFRSPRWGR